MCNRVMGVTFPGTMSAEAMALPPMILGRHPRGEPDLPVHPYEANPRTLKWNQTHFSYKVVAPIFMWGEPLPLSDYWC